jgi:hypothetical protein
VGFVALVKIIYAKALILSNCQIVLAPGERYQVMWAILTKGGVPVVKELQ